MLTSNTTDPISNTHAEKAREYLEAIRWPNGPVCPHCGVVNSATLKGQSPSPRPLPVQGMREAIFRDGRHGL